MKNEQLDFLKKILTGFIYPESANFPFAPRGGYSPYAILQRAILNFAGRRGIQLVKVCAFDAEARTNGRDWPGVAFTMVGLKRLDNVQHAIETILAERIPGDICECGVWRGGCSMFMRAVLKAHGNTDRTVWLADSFGGLPKPNAVKYPADRGDDLYLNQYLSVPLPVVQGNFQRLNLLDDQVKFLPGWFKDTLPTAPISQLAVLRADGDLYESTMDILNSLYHKVSPGGFIIIDDYHALQCCQLAVDEFRTRHEISAPLVEIDGSAVYWRKAR
jgi:O-methyltransferase